MEPRSTTECFEVTTTSRPRRLRRLLPWRGDPERPGKRVRACGLTGRSWIGVLLLASLSAVSTYYYFHGTRSLGRAPGRKVGDFAIKDVRTGQLHRLSDHYGRVVAMIFTGTDCPVGELYLPRLNVLARKYENRGVDFLAINSNASESDDAVALHARQSNIQIPVLKDTDNRVADLVLAERTCEALLIDGSGRLRYRGAIDDQYAQRSRRDSPGQDYLARAIEALIEERPVSPEMTQVVGCPIERTQPTRKARSRAEEASSRRAPVTRQGSVKAEPRSGPAVTYASDVAAILHRRCASCHRPGQVAPFSLLTFQQARRWAASIVEVIEERRMPPWHADARYGRFANDRSLPEAERTVLARWVEQGAPPGELSIAPVAPRSSQGWSIGTPDIVYEMPDPYIIQAEGTVPIQRFRVPSNLKEDLWVQAAEVRPGDRAVVHHICVFIEDYSQRQEGGPPFKNLLANYAPGDEPSVFPQGVAKKIPPGVNLLFEVHYTPIGKQRFDRSTIGLILSKSPPERQAKTRGIAGRDLKIPPRTANYAMTSAWTTRRAIHLLSLSPHMHLRGRSFKFTAQFPDGHREILLSVPQFDFHWQSVYRLAEPKAVPKDTVIQCDAVYDNTSANPANPDPDKTVLWGEQSWDEMMIGFIDYYEDEGILHH